jgi:hypothetical protein
LRFLDVFSGMKVLTNILEEQGLGPVGPETHAFNERECSMEPVSDPTDPAENVEEALFLIPSHHSRSRALKSVRRSRGFFQYRERRL